MQDIEQRWFPGVHSDVGGGYPEHESGLSKIPLIWMVEEAEKAGLIITPSNHQRLAYGIPKPGASKTGPAALHDYVKPTALAPIHKSLGLGWMPLEVIPKRTRHIETRNWTLFGFYLPFAEPRRLQPEHVIDDAVYCRRSRNETYRPRAELPALTRPHPECLYDQETVSSSKPITT